LQLIVKKFGGTSVADAGCIARVADIIIESYNNNCNIVVVVSAQGKFTDVLVEKATEINKKASRREMDVLLSAGEQISIALLAMEIEKRGFPVKSFLGWQAGFQTDSNYSNARIRRINKERIENELAKRTIVIVAGFQGVNKYEDITTLGRGGSDTSAVALAAVLNADACQIYTDVEGVYTADPRLVKDAVKLADISYDEMLELASLGAQVLHNRSVEMAKRFNVKLEVLSSIEKKPGTIIKEAATVEQMLIRGVTKDTNVARISLTELKDQPGIAHKVFSLLANNRINVEIILQSIGREDTKDITFTLAEDNVDLALEVLRGAKESIGYREILCDKDIAKVSIVGAGMESNPGIASKMFGALSDANVNIQMISTSEIKISVLINIIDAQRAVNAIHNAFFSV
jgi:aspartate kinase